MNPSTMQDFRDHAAAEYPRECCGLIVIVRGKERYVPCRNMAADASNFVLDPSDYATAEDMGEVVGVAHSHPDAGNLPSEADRVQMNAGDLPWYIVSVNEQGETSEVGRYEPDGYIAPLVGRSFSHGILDCYALVKDYYERELGIELPEPVREDGWWNRGQDLYMENFAAAGFAPINGPIQKHDVILMQVRSPVANHAGVYIGDGLMLHHMYNRLSTRDVYGGWYQEITRLIVRHEGVNNVG